MLNGIKSYSSVSNLNGQFSPNNLKRKGAHEAADGTIVDTGLSNSLKPVNEDCRQNVFNRFCFLKEKKLVIMYGYLVFSSPFPSSLRSTCIIKSPREEGRVANPVSEYDVKEDSDGEGSDLVDELDEDTDSYSEDIGMADLDEDVGGGGNRKNLVKLLGVKLVRIHDGNKGEYQNIKCYIGDWVASPDDSVKRDG
ncbi:MAG: hypothetical protein CMP21_03295 [Rickettsiales bacterium]|nr:hypothetical protein [Rickettsiales bacterium]|tara:strand:- start:70 stop:654 length:585 start_codon:yes stop_codon:yes gene_type:complete